MKTKAKEICEDCGEIFLGGANAFLCPKCRKQRIREGQRKRKEREKERRGES